MDWSGCELVEVIPGKVSGAPLLKGTRLPVDVILDSYDFGTSIEDIAENYPSASVETIKALIAYADSKEPPPRPIYYVPPGESLMLTRTEALAHFDKKQRQERVKSRFLA